jgi:hypothetical protein
VRERERERERERCKRCFKTNSFNSIKEQVHLLYGKRKSSSNVTAPCQNNSLKALHKTTNIEKELLIAL